MILCNAFYRVSTKRGDIPRIFFKTYLHHRRHSAPLGLLVMGPAERFAVDGNHIESIASEIQAGEPCQDCFLEGVGANQTKDSAGGIVGWNAIPELDEFLEPRKPELTQMTQCPPTLQHQIARPERTERGYLRDYWTWFDQPWDLRPPPCTRPNSAFKPFHGLQ
jgi:hypothetical protein